MERNCLELMVHVVRIVSFVRDIIWERYDISYHLCWDVRMAHEENYVDPVTNSINQHMLKDWQGHITLKLSQCRATVFWRCFCSTFEWCVAWPRKSTRLTLHIEKHKHSQFSLCTVFCKILHTLIYPFQFLYVHIGRIDQITHVRDSFLNCFERRKPRILVYMSLCCCWIIKFNFSF